jgi:hypothetical protein
MYERRFLPEGPFRREHHDLTARIDEVLRQLRDVWADYMSFIGIDDISATELNEYLRPNILARILYNRWVSDPNFFTAIV